MDSIFIAARSTHLNMFLSIRSHQFFLHQKPSVLLAHDEQHLAELFMLGQERVGITQRGVAKTGRKAKGVAATGGAAKGVKRGARHTPRRCNICSWFEKRDVIKVKGHKSSEAAKEAVEKEGLTTKQLGRAVIKMLGQKEEEEEAEGQSSISKGVL